MSERLQAPDFAFVAKLIQEVYDEARTLQDAVSDLTRLGDDLETWVAALPAALEADPTEIRALVAAIEDVAAALHTINHSGAHNEVNDLEDAWEAMEDAAEDEAATAEDDEEDEDEA